MTDAASRDAFEAFFRDSRSSKRRPTFERLADDTYADDHTQRHWWTWQQASQHRTQPVPMAWAHPDGRVIAAATKASAERDGGAMRSSLAGYTIPLGPLSQSR